ncbi:MAG TPA: glucose 1-dehydrogenase [Chthonomonadaceae bacterium]|nr:glucose 1-dehydrogenase [Chthonomonadaceae bacterium]
MFDLSGRVALVTGGSKGLGRAMAAALASCGAQVMICSRQQDEITRAAAEIAAETGQRVQGVVADMTQRADIEALVGATLSAFGKIDILINNAGAGLRRPLLEMSDEDWEGILSVCLTGPMRMARAVAPQMIQAGYGRIINISSSLGSIALPERAAYCSAKGGLLQLTKVMALEWALHGITVNAICPGPFQTAGNLKLQANPALYESYLGLIPQHRWAELSEIQGAAVFLASAEASFVTGTALYVDGGWTAHAGLPMAGASQL